MKVDEAGACDFYFGAEVIKLGGCDDFLCDFAGFHADLFGQTHRQIGLVVAVLGAGRRADERIDVGVVGADRRGDGILKPLRDQSKNIGHGRAL